MIALDPRIVRGIVRGLALALVLGAAVWLIVGELEARQRRAIMAERWRAAERQRILELLAEAHDRAVRL